ncbi:hypothetical protein AB6A40_002708 [Gnathostoma spinigerum]|uniref:Uncharacterized protein n=1 Tax=Gnathostoma spinigerum TaxID=75299 RepID=A0ABD6ECX0_9BILA
MLEGSLFVDPATTSGNYSLSMPFSSHIRHNLSDRHHHTVVLPPSATPVSFAQNFMSNPSNERLPPEFIVPPFAQSAFCPIPQVFFPPSNPQNLLLVQPQSSTLAVCNGVGFTPYPLGFPVPMNVPCFESSPHYHHQNKEITPYLPVADVSDVQMNTLHSIRGVHPSSKSNEYKRQCQKNELITILPQGFAIDREAYLNPVVSPFPIRTRDPQGPYTSPSLESLAHHIASISDGPIIDNNSRETPISHACALILLEEMIASIFTILKYHIRELAQRRFGFI